MLLSALEGWVYGAVAFSESFLGKLGDDVVVALEVLDWELCMVLFL